MMETKVSIFNMLSKNLSKIDNFYKGPKMELDKIWSLLWIDFCIFFKKSPGKYWPLRYVIVYSDITKGEGVMNYDDS